jgi:hypothetical protein
MVPKEMKYVVGLASGNMNTCNVNGFFFAFGLACNLCYLFGLIISYLSKIKYNISNQTFLKKYDKMIHVVTLGFTTFCSTFLVVTKSINSTNRAGFCYVLQSPMDCGSDCRGYEYRLYVFLLFLLPGLLMISGIMVCMFVIVHHVIVTDQITQCERGVYNEMMGHVDDRATSLQTSRTRTFPFVTGPCKFLAYLRSNEDTIEEDGNDIPSSHAVRSKLARRNRKLATTSALLYTISMVLIYFLPATASIMQFVSQRKIPIAMSLIEVTFFPLGGVMFIYAHTWHKINILQQRNRCSRIRAFVAIILAGGELPPESVNDGNRTEAISSILLQDISPPRKWYDVLGFMRDRAEKANVKKRYNKKAGYVIRRRAFEEPNESRTIHPLQSGNLEDTKAFSGLDLDSDASSEEIYEKEQEEKEDDNEGLSQARLRLWMKRGTSNSRTSCSEMSIFDIQKKYSVDVFCSDSDSTSD